MEEDQLKNGEDISIRGVKPPRTAFSTVMNSVGNWTMIGTLPFVIGESISHLQGKPLPPGIVKGNLALMATGCLLGTYFGFKEDKQLTAYRNALAKELNELHAKTDGQSPARS